MFETDAPTSKSARTRARISEAAIASFIERGYADTTMRSIAAAAGVSTSNAYYYFPSKDHLVQDLYLRVQHEHAGAARPLLEGERELAGRLRIVFETGLAAVQPYREVAPGFLSAMVSPDSPLNPLSRDSSPSREMAVALFKDAIDGAKHRLPDDIVALLPETLFLAYLALVLRWTYDDSPGQAKTSRMLDAGLRMLALTLPFVRVPGMHHVARELLELVTEVRS